MRRTVRMASPTSRRGTPPEWTCALCGGRAEDELGLLDHQQWCLGSGEANVRLLSEVAAREGELTQRALVAAARQKRGLTRKGGSAH
jgi:hypothetical protein